MREDLDGMRPVPGGRPVRVGAERPHYELDTFPTGELIAFDALAAPSSILLLDASIQ